MKNITILTICLTVMCFTGCLSMVKAPDMSALKPPGPVTSVVAAWHPAVSNGENSMRGFGGRVYLYDQDMRPTKAKGTIVVYLFDEDGRSPDDAKPDEGITFDAKMLNSRDVYAKSKLGHSYKLWIPVDAAGPDGQARKMSLIVRYIPEKGASQVSTQATVDIPGRRNQETVIVQQPDWQNHTESAWQQLTQARLIESNINRPMALQAVTIR